MAPPGDLDALSPTELKALVLELLGKVAALEQTVAAQRAEIARLKGLKGRPVLKPSGMETASEPKPPSPPKGRRGPVRPRVAVEDQVIEATVPLGSRFKGYADFVRHITRRWIPFAERRGLEDMTLGPTAYLAAKAKGDRSMPSKRERSEDADDPVPQGPRDTVRTGLFEPQSPAMQAYIPRHSVFRRGHRDRATRMSSLEPSTRWAMGHHPIQGGERGTYVALDTSSTAGMWDRPMRREAQGDGAAVVLRGRESRPHGEGRQVS